MENRSSESEPTSITPEFELDFDDLFEKFSRYDITGLSQYQEQTLAEGGMTRLLALPISETFKQKFPKEFDILGQNSDLYDNIYTPKGEELEKLINEDVVVRAIKTSRAGDKIIVGFRGNKTEPQLRTQQSSYSSALRIRRSVVAYLGKMDSRSPETITVTETADRLFEEDVS